MLGEKILHLLSYELYEFVKEVVLEHHELMCVSVGDYDLKKETERVYNLWKTKHSNNIEELTNDIQKQCAQSGICDFDDIIDWTTVRKTVDPYLPKFSPYTN